ncbi:hypothetical protein [Streptomyces sp. NPDC006971]|uniref:hypothetical protein n=1 Tax=Streptomyces sp. NPDC006971 TaxID=3154784 RepID=UPI0033C436AA
MTAGFEVHLFLVTGQPDPAACSCPRAACGGFTKLLDECSTHRPRSGDAPIMGFKQAARCCPSEQPATA